MLTDSERFALRYVEGTLSHSESFALHYVDGTLSYAQALHEAEKCGVSKEDFDAAVFAWRKAGGEVKRTSVDKRNGWEMP